MNRYALSMAAGVMVAGLAADLSAAVLISQNFENQTIFPTGQTINNTTGRGDATSTVGHWISNNNNGHPLLTVDPTDENNHVARVERIGGGATTLYGSRQAADAVSTGILSFAFDIYRNSAPVNSALLISVHNVTELPASNTVPLGVYVNDDGLVHHRNASDTGWTPTGTTLATNAWYTIEGTADLDAGTWTVSVNGNVVMTDAEFRKASIVGVNSIGFLTAAPDTGTYLVDNVQLEVVPEPAGLMLLAAGGAGLMARRRK